MTNHSGESEPSKGERKKSKLFFYVLFFILLLVIGVILCWFFRQPSIGDVTILMPDNATSVETIPRVKTYKGEYISFQYPGQFEQKNVDNGLKKPIVERAYFTETGLEGRKIALLIQEADYPLDEFSSYRMRLNDKITYEKEVTERTGQDITLFSKKSIVFEEAAFLVHKGKVVSLVVSSPTTNEGLRDELFSILDTVKWVE